MHLLRFITPTLALVTAALAVEATPSSVCVAITHAVSNATAVFYPGSPEYDAAIHHPYVSSSQESACAVEPGTAQDVGRILRLVGPSRTPFAVKCGGHTANPGFSSTPGVQIAMSRLSSIKYLTHSKYQKDAPNGVVVFGAGLLWNEIYSALDPLNITVVGGRVVGVGSAGFILGGGGYSFHSNQYGLAADNVFEFELVTPDGVVHQVSAKSDPDLFWALKGGGNNFGIVTSFTVRAIPYTRVWGALAVHVFQSQAYINTISSFQATITDPKASMLSGFSLLNGTSLQYSVMFYDGPEPPVDVANVFNQVLGIPSPVLLYSGSSSMSELLVGIDLSPLVQPGGSPMRSADGTLGVETYTSEFLDAMVHEIELNAALLGNDTSIGYNVEPFLPSFLTKPARTSDSAFPPTSSRPFSASPFMFGASWLNAADDHTVLAAIGASVDRLQAVETNTTGRVLPRYPNFAPADTKLVQMFGADGVKRLRKVARRVDPSKIMALAGGFKV